MFGWQRGPWDTAERTLREREERVLVPFLHSRPLWPWEWEGNSLCSFFFLNENGKCNLTVPTAHWSLGAGRARPPTQGHTPHPVPGAPHLPGEPATATCRALGPWEHACPCCRVRFLGSRVDGGSFCRRLGTAVVAPVVQVLAAPRGWGKPYRFAVSDLDSPDLYWWTLKFQEKNIVFFLRNRKLFKMIDNVGHLSWAERMRKFRTPFHWAPEGMQKVLGPYTAMKHYPAEAWSWWEPENLLPGANLGSWDPGYGRQGWGARRSRKVKVEIRSHPRWGAAKQPALQVGPPRHRQNEPSLRLNANLSP